MTSNIFIIFGLILVVISAAYIPYPTPIEYILGMAICMGVGFVIGRSHSRHGEQE